MMKHARGTVPVAALRHLQVRRGSFALTIEKLNLMPGEVTCIVGPNGCGKTTLLLSLLGLLPHEGTCLINGRRYDGSDPEVKSVIGFIPDDPELLFTELTAQEQWSVTASVVSRIRHKGLKKETYIQRALSLAASIGFEPPAQLAREYSHGMRKKTQIVQALLGKPSVIVIDELRNGLDPIAIHRTEQLIRDECDRGAAVCTATHDLWWAERFADYIVVLNAGCIVAEGTAKQLMQEDETDLETAFHRIVGANT